MPAIEDQLILFTFFWAFTDRFREVAIFPGWVTRFWKWFETHYNPNQPIWNPIRTAYHTFKNSPVSYLFVLMWLQYGFWKAFQLVGTWYIGQTIGLIIARK